ncbi:methyltransferase family protein [Sedimenticola selenatireducens]|jgi:protein-S-isoprenylcysteine O-methyltransferase Ste14|uniref:Isoprenylcysteine carboxylmethyltransferase family protein n=1 Tax=Sedimenticola selenatireducens TaxID=191960 RepID=A0A558DQE3_9GAMM|nr:isoprenylcysteine carboxylmethyltransferase family protein [Sedimenticola selenatireducens]TVO73013.1 isoprenylcysteine carboxylmethyltransferase family protein [Sedimenticola selenatireducens]TVT63227.1 MAG: isoprenylcysteine carboxylmethyltransferase family protein [Sedimenticola selenatireducens]
MTQEYAYGMWVIAAFNVGLFLFFFMSFLPPKGFAEWRNLGVATAFLVALFSEMYGFPLTIYLLTGWLGDAYPVLQPFNHKFGHLWVVVFGGSWLVWALVMGSSLILMVAGYVLLKNGWRQIYDAHGRMVTDGLYAYVRHPQYTGLFLVITGFLVQWPTLLTVLMAPILLYSYVHLARSEERRMSKQIGEPYVDYMHRIPAFFPPLNQWKAFFTTNSQGKPGNRAHG